jgi:Uma2 family endonuclease
LAQLIKNQAIKSLMLTEVKKYSFDDFWKFYQRTGERGGFEFSEGLIYDKYAGKPLDDSIVDYVLSDIFNENELPLFEMPTIFHDRIVSNILIFLMSVLRPKNYLVYSQKTAIPKTINTINYREPDLVIVDKNQEQRNKYHQVTNPLMLVEVLSKSTENTDLVEKLEEYQKIESVQTYMIVWQDKPKILVYTRQEEFVWEERIYEGLEKVAFLPFFQIEIPLKGVYEDVGV